VGAGFTAVTCDMPAHGETEGSTTSVAEFLDAIEQIASLVGPLHGVVAHSLGGTAATLAISRHLRVQGVVLVAPMGSFDFALDEFARMLSLDEDLREVTACETEKRVGMRREEVDLVTKDLPPMPALIFHDRDDVRTLYGHSQALAERWDGARFHGTEGLGHKRILAAKEVLDATVDFFTGLPRRQTDPLELGVVPELLDAPF
jgi:pimeloyl-ACP methyl ester carboxylesterase